MAFIAEELTAGLNPQNSVLSRKRFTRRGRKQYPRKSNLTLGYVPLRFLSSQRSMSCELNKHILPHLKETPLEEITYPIVRSLIQTWQREGLSRNSIKNLFGIVCAIYNFQFDEMAQCGSKAVVSPWLVKWKKVARPKTVQRELPYFTVARMAAIVKGARTQLNRALFALAAGSGARAGELFALRVESDVNLNEQTVTIHRSVFEAEENASKSDTGDEDRTRTVPVDASVVMELKKHLQGRRSGYPFETRNGTPQRLSNVLEAKLQPILRNLKLLQPGMACTRFGGAGFLISFIQG